ncbi:hypothetical protein OGAPHI_005434 [Ogataea philodendri]|uniref:E3 ubiquitin-protein ligase n=1 Tax=Ogataea philodendri TaxID=1378263 RepID=A0A9P8NZL6_9ASCO|nr:uncharacterized protein OGAPHI_005434 [Ogataea philodendri]KAH3662186.1 hypothetical protein OGAPHI_005434 [Ogataea philodendri]
MSISSKLNNILVQLPRLFDYSLTPDLETSLIRVLYYALSGDSKYYELLFPDLMINEEFPSNWESTIVHDYHGLITKGRFYDRQKQSTSKAHHGRICAQKIEKDQVVYNCYDCGIDETCCLCDDCFNKEQHSDHDVGTHISNGDAICDCGDHESWKCDLKCVANSMVESEPDDLPTELVEIINEVIRTVFDYFLDVQALNTHTVPGTQRYLYAEKNPDLFKLYSETAQLSKDKYGSEDTNSDVYCLIVWNDEFHDWTISKQSIAMALPTTASDHKKNQQLTQEIDREGKSIISTSKNIDVLMKQYYKVQTHGLTATIVSARDATRDFLCENIINWLVKMTSHPNSKISECVKISIANAMFEQYNTVHEEEKTVGKYFSFSNPDNVGNLLPNFKIPQLPGSVLKKDVNISMLKHIGLALASEHLEPEEYAEATTTRIQMFFFMEMRLWKKLRKTLRSLLLPTLTTSYQYREILADQIVEILPLLELIQAKHDREWNLSLMDHFRLQIYLDPKIGTHLLTTGKLCSVFQSTIQIFKENVLPGTDKYSPEQNVTDWKVQRLLNAESACLRGLETLTNYIKPGYEDILGNRLLCYLILTLRMFDQSWSLKRKRDVHVEIESQESKLYFIRAHQAYNLTKNVGKIIAGLDTKSSVVEEAIAIIGMYLTNSSAIYDNDLDIIKYEVSKEKTSFINPVHSLLAEVCRNYKFFDLTMLERNKSGLPSGDTWDPETTQDEINLFAIADQSLRSQVLSAQILSGFWVRNGQEAMFQELSYRFIFNPEGDLYLNQLSVLFEPSIKRSLLNIFDRYELLKCINGNQQFDKTIYEERGTSIIGEMVHFFYRLLTYRVFFDKTISASEIDYLKTKYAICYKLSLGPVQYTDLKRAVDSSADFDRLLKEVSVFNPPTGINDYGHYSLKPELYSELDHLSYFNKSNSQDDLEMALFNNIAANKKKKVEEVVIHPQIYPLKGDDLQKFAKIGAAFRSPLFVKFIYKALSFAISSENDNFVPHLLHLVHAIIVDDGLYNSENDQSLQAFIDIPVSNLLLTLIEKEDVSKFVAKKASYILDLLLTKDESVLQSLIDCFGQAHIDEFKKTARGKVLETKKERAKRLALKRQQKIMKKLTKQQAAFVENNKVFFDEPAPVEKPEADKLETELRTCIYCRNPENYKELFGMPTLISHSSVFWNVPIVDMDAPSLMIPGFPTNNANSRKRKWQDLVENISCFGTKCTRSKYVITGCLHGMHYSCFHDYLKENHADVSQYTCPLCQSYCNSFIPTSRFPDFELEIASELKSKTWQNIYNENQGDNCSELSGYVFDKKMFRVLSHSELPEYRTIMRQLRTLMKENRIMRKVVKSSSQQLSLKFSLPILLGNTLEMYEISSRTKLKPDEEDLSSKDMTLLRSLVQFRVLLNYLPPDPPNDYSRFAEYKSLVRSDNFGSTTEMLLLYMEGNESFDILMRLELTKWMVKALFSLISRYSLNPGNLNVDSVLKPVEPLEGPLKETFVLLTKKCAANLFRKFISEIGPAYYNDELITKLNTIMVNIFDCYYRQLMLVKQTFNLGGGEFPTYQELLGNLQDTKSLEYSVSIQVATSMSNYLSSTNSLVLDFPGKVHLCELPEKLTDFLKYDSIGKEKAADRKYLCLFCGSLVKKLQHLSNCKLNDSSYSLFFSPFNNKLEFELTATKNNIFFDIQIPNGASVSVGSPYFNRHGEPAGGLLGAGESGTLHLPRYNYINKIWLNQYLISTIYRDLHASILSRRRVQPFQFGIPTQNQTRLSEDEEMSEDDDDDAEAMDPEEYLTNLLMRQGYYEFL